MNQKELQKQVVKVIQMFLNEKERMHLPKLDEDAISHGLRNSWNACAQPQEVVATPWMKNLLIALGDIRQQKGKDGTITHTRLEVGNILRLLIGSTR